MGIEEADYQAASDAFDQGLSIARQEGDVALELRTLAGASYVDFFHLRWRECLKRTPRSIDLIRNVSDLHAEILVHQSAGVAEFALGNPDAARGRVTIPDSVKDCQTVQVGQWHRLTGAGWFLAQSFQFFCY